MAIFLIFGKYIKSRNKSKLQNTKQTTNEIKINELTGKSYQHKVCYSLIDYHLGLAITANNNIKR